jgi:hypothetical protein
VQRFSFAVVVVCLTLSLSSLAKNLTIAPTTTLTAQTSNNTSTANSFLSQSNGNLGASNVSKVDVHSLLYSGATTQVFAHLMLWWGESTHIDVGYSSNDATQVARQINDMISRGIQGVILCWYGPNNDIDSAAQLAMKEAEKHPGFSFFIMIDTGAIQWDSCSGCSAQQALVSDLQYLQQTYFSSPAYLKFQGKPVVTNFDIDLHYSVDWTAAGVALNPSPVFLFQNSAGFSHANSQGTYSWVIPTTTDFGMSYLNQFYTTGKTSPNDMTVGAVYKGFNDTLASWSLNRIMDQQCGQTWLQTFSELNGLYNSSNQLPALGLVTWNDYEEGTELESGIDNCLTVSSTLNSSTLEWSVNGNENTVDHYTVYASTDGENLMALADEPNGTHSVDMCNFSLAPGSYDLYVQAVGKPFIKNQMSGSSSYTSACSTALNPPSPGPNPVNPSITLSATPQSLNVAAGQSETTSLAVATSGTFNGPVALSCSNLPAGMTCTLSPNQLIPGKEVSHSTVTISTGGSGSASALRSSAPKLFYAMFLSFGISGFAFVGSLEKKRITRTPFLIALIGTVLLASSCGGSPSTNSQSLAAVPVGQYTVVINATSGAARASTSLTVNVQ